MNEREYIENELQGEAPALYRLKLRRSQPFRVPEGYFSSLADRLEEAALSPSVDFGKSVESFKIPGNYFESLPGEIMERIRSEEESVEREAVTIHLNDHRRRERVAPLRMMPLAAAVAVFVLLGILAAQFIRQDAKIERQVALSQEEAMEYLSAYWVDFSDDELALLAGDADAVSFLEGSDITGETWQQYLEENPGLLDEYYLTVEI